MSCLCPAGPCYNQDTSVRLADFLSATPVDRSESPPVTRPVTVVRGSPGARHAVSVSILANMAASAPDTEIVEAPPAAEWPFLWPPLAVAASPRPQVLWAPDLHEAFVNAQTNATRLVTMQPMYVMQVLADLCQAAPGLRIVATVEPSALAAHADDALAGRGAWRFVEWRDAGEAAGDAPAPPALGALPRAFRAPAVETRLLAAGQALDTARTPAHLLAMASVCMEANDLGNAAELLAEAARTAPDWAAAHFERGKCALRTDDLPAAADAFGAAARLLPGFASAAANWGATLGELDRPDEALQAFRRALDADPENPQALNNIGVVSRELGRLGEAEAAFRAVITRTPGLAFGHYNLGHTLFLQGRYQASLAAYLAGQQRDPDRNPVQASRLALARLASGDAAGALADLKQCAARLPADLRRQVLGDAQSVAWALLSAAPELRDWRLVGDWLAAELARA